MSDTTTDGKWERVCPNCGAKQPRQLDQCWLCGEAFDEAATGVVAHEQPTSYSLSTLLLIMTLACICFALIAAAPGLGVFVGILLVPVFIRTSMVLKKREAEGIVTSWLEKWSLALGSFAAATVMATVVLSTSFAAFCFSCLAGYSAAGNGNDGGPILLACLVGGSVLLLMVYLMAKWARVRFRRDTSRR
jgi:hypothetical protein